MESKPEEVKINEKIENSSTEQGIKGEAIINKPGPISQDENFNELVSMGFDPVLVDKALKLTNDREKAVELILQFQADGPQTTITKKEEPKNTPFFPQAMNHKMIICVRQDLGMGTGKIAAQVGHAVLGAYKNIIEGQNMKHRQDLYNWEECGQAKIVVKVKSKEELLKVEEDARNAGLNTCLIQDAGRTQIEPGSFTVVAIGPATSAELDKITGHLKLL